LQTLAANVAHLLLDAVLVITSARQELFPRLLVGLSVFKKITQNVVDEWS